MFYLERLPELERSSTSPLFFFFDLITSPQQQQPFKASKDSQTPHTDTHSIVQQGSDTSFLEIVCCYISSYQSRHLYCSAHYLFFHFVLDIGLQEISLLITFHSLICLMLPRTEMHEQSVSELHQVLHQDFPQYKMWVGMYHLSQ